MRRSEALIDLSREHHQALVLSKQLAELEKQPKAEQTAAWQVLQPTLHKELLPHFDEEEALLAGLQLQDPHPLLMQLLAEHQQLKQYLASDSTEVLAPLAALLKQHVRFEERELFNWLEREVGAARIAELRMARGRR